MIIPAVFKVERVDIRENNNYICCTDSYLDVVVINVFDKREQRIIYNNTTTKEDTLAYLYIITEYDISNIKFLEKKHEELLELCIDEDSIIFNIVNSSIVKLPSIKLHIKRIAQIYEHLDKYNLNLELESKFDRKRNRSCIYLYNENVIDRYNQIVITYNYSTGLFSYSINKELINSVYFLDEIFTYITNRL